MGYNKAFNQFWEEQTQGYDESVVSKVTPEDIAFLQGYYCAVEELPQALIHAREETKENAGYKAFDGFIEEITKQMYDDTINNMRQKVNNTTTSILEDYTE